MSDTLDEIKRINRRARFALVILVGAVGVWAATAPLSGAVIARGTVTVESNLKRVQHQSGGIVSEILVREGDRVKEGDLLFRLDATQVSATLSVLQAQWISLRAREARLLAERDNAESVTTPQALAASGSEADVAQAIAGERALFESRRRTRVGQEAQLKQRLSQLAQESEAMIALASARDEEALLLAGELKGMQRLHRGGYVTMAKLSPMQRDMTRLHAERMQYAAEAERIKGRASEVELEVLRRQSEHQSQVVDALRAIQVEVAEVEQKRAAAQDNLRRLEARAPRSGVVLGSKLHTLGGVIGAGETVMQIVPENDPLVIEARVPPRDIDQVAPGAHASVKLLAGNQRTASDLSGKVLHVSADLARDEGTNEAYFAVRISLDRAEVERRAGFRAQAGMGAEAFIKTGERTAFAYLLQPVSDQLDRAMRER